MEQDIVAAGAQIIWVLEQDVNRQPGTRRLCEQLFDVEESERGICVGDNQTMPEAGTFDDSPFSLTRGFDILVERESMKIVWASTHGTTAGNENLSSDEVLQAVRDAVASTP
ncbi:MAG: hypothetical protein AAF602_16645 [Myxococcota bacterium]